MLYSGKNWPLVPGVVGMKNFLVVIAFVMGLAFLNPISAQNTKDNQKAAKAEREATKAAAKNKAIDLTGTLRKEGDKTTFIISAIEWVT